MTPTNEWLSLWKRQREKLKCPVDLNAYFTLPEIASKQLAVMDIGPCSIPTGQILVRDPLYYLGNIEEQPYFQTVPAGIYPTEVCVVKQDEEGDCARYAAVRLRFVDVPAVRFEEALVGNEDLLEMGDDEFFGFNVDAGLACICDKRVHQAFCDFVGQWHKEHPGDNLYDDYFANLFAESFRQNPEYQRDGGDWLNWQIPDTEYHLPIFQSGFGDGAYPVYWGYDEKGEICQMIIQFIDIQLAYGEEQTED
ncbi:DUF4241 domain-containing protein [Aneurinibacillus aneurinilyticus]|jgi:hypothetical protein|uniref:DUF4241 domain-containing protein n=2 Tax=Aneurinibacillus aneurinilyticus TaxID=1391 RepID=A0A848CV32_ANEAE|nr:DUF4241 domain-containing protein [Aneurinibacillus aneurinilyticus]ERI11754.1 hypothetical protein HMPREF0083_00155 [Aneurinibacillus aneurinilyticus ATCC 12856]MCI1696799.1 DUF4241 domain-containing protein [Aneurinibacillus aneurinilyticus]MED0705653.1 DUF4241 domain-containing protein [Aneurinibacillus aneurinilyticus]MED0724243.1 DUF4241 domain-containing protein [Aneurinibacillus aneurinilyticus]MED0734754.1 DUF4241 domain-containing protein [Aneurinibacillus aneurinilyticus]